MRKKEETVGPEGILTQKNAKKKRRKLPGKPPEWIRVGLW